MVPQSDSSPRCTQGHTGKPSQEFHAKTHSPRSCRAGGSVRHVCSTGGLVAHSSHPDTSQSQAHPRSGLLAAHTLVRSPPSLRCSVVELRKLHSHRHTPCNTCPRARVATEHRYPMNHARVQPGHGSHPVRTPLRIPRQLRCNWTRSQSRGIQERTCSYTRSHALGRSRQCGTNQSRQHSLLDPVRKIHQSTQ